MNANVSSTYLPQGFYQELNHLLLRSDEIFRPGIDRLNTIIASISEGKDTGEGWVHISAIRFKKKIGSDYNKYLKWLGQKELIEIDNYYIVGKRSRAYRIHQKFNKKEPVLLELRNHRQNGKASGTDFRFLDDFDKKLQINEDRAFKSAEEKYCENVAKYDQRLANYKDRINKAKKWEYKSVEKNYRPASPEKSRLRAYNYIHNILNGVSIPKQDAFGGRAYFNSTMIPSYLRKYLTYNGLDQNIVDITASQPFILSMIWNNPHYLLYLLIHLPMIYFNREGVVVPRFKIGEKYKRISIEEVEHILKHIEPFIGSFDNQLTHSIMKAFKRLLQRSQDSSKYPPILRCHHMVKAVLRLFLSETFQAILNGKLPEDIVRFQEALDQGNLYELLTDRFDCNRERAKTTLMINLFSANNGRSQRKAILKSMFPTLTEILIILKRDDKLLLSFLLQFLESSVMLYHIAKNVNTKYPYINLHLIHDAIMTSNEYMPLIKKEVEESFAILVGKTPRIKCKS